MASRASSPSVISLGFILASSLLLVVDSPSASAAPGDTDCKRACRARAHHCARACPDADCRAACRAQLRRCLDLAGQDADGDGVGDACQTWLLTTYASTSSPGQVAGVQEGVSFPPEVLSISAGDVQPLPPFAPVDTMAVNTSVAGQVRVAAVKLAGFTPPGDVYAMTFHSTGRAPTPSDFLVFECIVTDSIGADLGGLCTLTLTPVLPL